MPHRSFLDVIGEQSRAIAQLSRNDAETVTRAVALIRDCTGRIICTGMGKSGHVARKIAATFASTGTPAHFVHPAEASHGDLGMITPDDVILALSNSGESRELADLITYSRRFRIPLIAITRDPQSALARHADLVLRLPDTPETCAIQMAPTTSSTCSMVLGDALAVAVMRERGFTQADFGTFHPGGQLGAQLRKVSDLMHRADALPVVGLDTPMPEAILEMTSKGFGVACVVARGQLAGIVTDGDLRRNMDGLMDKTVRAVYTPDPRVVRPDMLASQALTLMNAAKITVIPAVSGCGALAGILHLHDCLRAGLA